MQTKMTASQIQKVCSSTHLNLLLKIHQHILETSGFTFPAFSSQENQSLHMEFSSNFPETFHCEPHVDVGIPHENMREDFAFWMCGSSVQYQGAMGRV